MDVRTMESRIYAARFLSSLPKEVLLAGLEQTISSLGVDKVQNAMDSIGMSGETKQFFADAKVKARSQDRSQDIGLDNSASTPHSTNSSKWRP
ncbi:hypothetical protein ACEUAI_18865 [Aeromonas veronii]|uniref:hypothetical protein n=1 Tax=Aeromonas hydrophila TaxID=644 RepID=UPI002B45B7B9|nr:hypothetical protein [Aeromonas hydrophila]